MGLGCKLVLGLPFKDIATSDSILLTSVPAKDDSAAWQTLKRLQEGNMGVLVKEADLRQNEVPNSVQVSALKDLQAGDNALFGGAERLAVEITGDESEEDLAKLASISP